MYGEVRGLEPEVFSAPNLLFFLLIFQLDVKSYSELIPHGRVYAEVYQPDILDITLTWGNSYIQYFASYSVQISYFLFYLLTDYRPEYSLYISSYVML